jgi:hypothetical protein
MRTAVRLLTGFFLCVVAVLVGSSTLAFGEVSSSAGSPGASTALAGPLVLPGGLGEGQQAQAAEEAKRDSPEAVAARDASLTKYAGLSPGEASKVDSEAFPAVIDHPAGGLPPLRRYRRGYRAGKKSANSKMDAAHLGSNMRLKRKPKAKRPANGTNLRGTFQE